MKNLKLKMVPAVLATLLLLLGWVSQEVFAQAQGRVTVAKSGENKEKEQRKEKRKGDRFIFSHVWGGPGV